MYGAAKSDQGMVAVDERIGQQVAATRTARRMTQRQLADAAHISLSTLRKVEQGTRPATDRTLEAVANALGVEPYVLTGRQRPRVDSRVHRAIPKIRTAIDAYDLPDDGPVRPLPELRRAAEDMTRLRLASQYTRIAETVSPLLVELTRAMHEHDGAHRQDSAELLTAALRAADAVAYKVGYYDLSARLVELMRWSARQAENPLLEATAAYVRAEVFFASRNLAQGLRALEQALDAMPSLTTTPARAAAGALHMRAAVMAARLTEDPSSVGEHLEAARRLAADVPEGIYAGTAFGPVSFHVHEVSVAVELGEAARAVEVAGQSVVLDELPAERRSHHHIEVARAQLWLGCAMKHSFRSKQPERQRHSMCGSIHTFGTPWSRCCGSMCPHLTRSWRSRSGLGLFSQSRIGDTRCVTRRER